jgi:hypothetical protein
MRRPRTVRPLRAKLDTCLTGCRLAKDRAAESLTKSNDARGAGLSGLTSRMKANTSVIPRQPVEDFIRIIRGQRVILDSDLALVYGVPTKQLNQAVKRNPDRFPADFAYQLTNQEVAILRSQFVTSSS